MKLYKYKIGIQFLYAVFLVVGIACKKKQVKHEASVTDKKNEKPNIILIMSDDMGYSDIDAYGGEVNTPALDSLAKNGMKFTQFYNTARCWT